MIGQLEMDPNPAAALHQTGTMGTWTMAWRLIRYDFRLWLADAVAWGMVWSLPAATGLVVKAIFDNLTGDGAAGFTVPTLLAAMAGVGAARRRLGHFCRGLMPTNEEDNS